MAFGGFTKNSGPSARPGAPAPAFGHFPRPPSPSSVSPRSSIDYSDIDAREVTHSAPAFEHSNSGRGSSRPLLGMQRIVNPPLRWGETNTSSSRNYDAQTYQRSPELLPRTASSNLRTHNPANIKEVQYIGRTSQADLPYSNSSFSVPARARSPPLALQNNLYVDAQHPPSNGQQRPFSSPVLRNQANSYNNYNSPPAPEGMASVTTVGGAYGSGPIPQSKRTDAPLQKWAISPTLTSNIGASKESTNYPSDGWKRSPIDYSDLDAPKATPSKPVNFERSSTGRDSHSFAATQKAFASPIWHHSQPSTSNTYPNVPDDFLANSSTRGFHQPERALEIKHADVPLPKRTRSPDPSYGNEPFSRSPVISSDAHKRALDPQSHKLSSVSGQTTSTGAADDKLMHFPAVKKTKLPFVSSSVEETLDSGQEIERELNAKAKRLARFKEELSQPVNSNVQAKRHHQSMPEKQRFPENQIGDTNGDSTSGSFLPECEGMASSSSIIGLCSDMCPESERAERERKGDLDQYERLDGDRNLSSEFLAVKKYTRTAEREAELIRPLPILQKTMDYLLDLLDQPYDDKFLGLYNFLWDRMRAIRMDLRMQHIFNLEAISMLEQMIRLHIIAMHELCEYTKGEGFSEGFDAHLNIEQMNKASVELFQFYDDHRKKGIHVLSEREFRGYYALLKLDKHPGYKVEPAELSLDLAKMAPDMRQSPEVLFARDVARACRTGNFIAFFRLARKASYLQACLMHAHFSKLRTQALASLHSGLQNNQGIPVAHIAKWLGMEEEDIENLLEYHGFSVKDFKEPFMMKESAFVNVDNDFPVKRSKLVESKRSRMIVSDISSPSTAESFAAEIASELRPNRNVESKPTQIQNVLPVNSAIQSDVEMHVPGAIVSPKGNIQKPIHKPSVDLLMRGDEWTGNEVHLASPRPMVLDPPKISSESIQTRVEPAWKPKYDPIFRDSLDRTINQESNQTKAESAQKLNYDPIFRNSFGRTIDQDRELTPPITLETAVENKSPVLSLDFAVDNQISQDMFVEDLEDAHTVGVEEDNIDEVSEDNYDKEIAEAKLKLILRIWKLRSTKKREARERKLLAANAALSSLSLGPPIWQYEHQSGNHDMFNIDDIMSERREIQERSWSLLNPSDVVATKLLLKNPDAKCLCWKMVLCSQETLLGNDAVPQNEVAQSAVNSWLHSKLMPANNVDDRDLLISSDGLAIWKSWIHSQSGNYPTCCLSVIKNCKFEDLNEGIAGASAVLFIVSDNTPLELQKYRLHDLISSLPSGSRLPLLILSGSGEGRSATSIIAKDLELHGIDKSRVIAFQVIFLKDQKMRKLDGFFSSERLREGLEWLAGESPPQMTIQRMKTRELVLSYLNSTLDNLDEMNDDRVGPNYCVSSFNEVLDHSMNEVAAAALSNPTGWPCPEIGLLEESSDEYKTAAWYLPSLGWSSAARIENIMSALNDSKLPTFTDDLSWLSTGLSTRYDVVNRKLQIENCLKNYLMETAQMMEETLVQKETNIMLQKCTQLELHNTTFYIIPNWVSIFRRIFSWRLMNLTRSEVSSVYVLAKQDHSTQGSEVVDNSELRGNTFLPTYIVQPSLDELIEVSCNPDGLGYDMDYEGFPHSLLMASDVVDIPASNENEETVAQNGTLLTDTEVQGGAQNMNATETSNGEADRLSQMLKRCNMLQDLIDKKLSIYF